MLHAAVLVAFRHLGDPGRATRRVQGLTVKQDDAERFVFLDAFGNHQFVANLEDVQREGDLRKQDDA